jgi:hypothetical protein
MSRTKLLTVAAAAVLALAACGARTGNNASEGNGSAEGKAEEGRVTVHTPGMDLKIDVPAPLRREAGIRDENGLIYPDATMSGVHVEAAPNAPGRGHGGVELAFTSAAPPDRVARWYQDPARARHFTIATADRDGPAFVLTGTRISDGDGLRIRLAPRAGGGTEGRVAISDSD